MRSYEEWRTQQRDEHRLICKDEATGRLQGISQLLAAMEPSDMREVLDEMYCFMTKLVGQMPDASSRH